MVYKLTTERNNAHIGTPYMSQMSKYDNVNPHANIVDNPNFIETIVKSTESHGVHRVVGTISQTSASLFAKLSIVTLIQRDRVL